MEATSALSAVDIACHDLVGRSLGVPISTLLGGAIRTRGARLLERLVLRLHRSRRVRFESPRHGRRGFPGPEVRPVRGPGPGRSRREALGLAVARVGAVREAVGELRRSPIQYHGRFLPEAAVRAGRALDAFHPRFMEEPVLPELCDSLRGFRRAVETPVALGERLLCAADFESFLRRGLVDILQPDITNSGGFTYGREIAGVAAAHGAPVRLPQRLRSGADRRHPPDGRGITDLLPAGKLRGELARMEAIPGPGVASREGKSRSPRSRVSESR